MSDRRNPAAVALGALGGAANTPAQAAARKRCLSRKGWPKGKPRGPRKAPPPA